jgi:hypothetical protein
VIWRYKRVLADGSVTTGVGVPAMVLLDGRQQQVVYQLPGGQEWAVVDLRSGQKIATITQQHLRPSIPETVAAALRDKLAGVPSVRAAHINSVPEVLGCF